MMMKVTLAISLFIISLLLLGLSSTLSSYSQLTEHIDNEENFSFLIPSDWKVVSKPDDITKEDKSTSDSLLNVEFPYYEQQNNTIVALTLRGISEMDLDRHSYIAISVQNLEKYFDFDISSNIDKTESELLEIISQEIENNLSKGFSLNVINKNSTSTLDGQPAFQIIFEPLGCFCLEGNTITVHNGKLYDIHFHAGVFMTDKALQDLNNLTSSFHFLN